jgi:23S rRNA (uracil1939-C5)-methyltransferase
VVGIVQSLNPDRTNRILGERNRTVAGRDHFVQTILDKDFRVSARSFFQVNTSQAEVLCRKVLKHVAPAGDERVIDLYSGVGMLSILIAGFVRKVTAVELDGSAVADAKHNAEANGATNVELVKADVDTFMDGDHEADCVVIDPPRKGCQRETLKRIAGLKPRRIVYVSCDPATLARDLRALAEDGYETRDVEPVDMFPQTAHVETIVTLEPSAEA